MLPRMTIGLVLLGASIALPGGVCVDRSGSRTVSCIELTSELIGGDWFHLLGIPAVRRVRITLCMAKRYRAATGTSDQATTSQGLETGNRLGGLSAMRY